MKCGVYALFLVVGYGGGFVSICIASFAVYFSCLAAVAGVYFFPSVFLHEITNG